MADDLPDAPWATGDNALPDAPWATKRPDSGQRTMLGLRTPQDLGQAPERPEGYLPTWQQFHEEAEARMGKGYEALSPKPHQTIGQSLYRPFEVAGGLYDIGAGAVQRTIAPATAAFRNYVSVPVEKATGLPAENLEAALQTVNPAIRGKVSPLAAFERPPRAPTLEELARRTDPRRASPTSLPGTLQRPPVINMGDLERALSPPEASQGVDMGALEREITRPQGAPTAPVAVPREDAGVSLLPPETPHALPRASVGAAGAGTDVLSGYSPEAIASVRDLLAENGLDNPNRLEQALSDTSSHHFLGELTPGLEGELGKLNAADKGEARNTITQSVLERASEAPQRISASMDRAFGPPQNRAALRESIEAARSQAAAPLWRQFTQTSVSPTPELRALLPRLDAAGALKAANKAMREEGLAAQQGFARTVTDEAGEWAEQVEHMPTAAAFQYAKEHLDGLIEKSLAEPGGAKAARRYTQLKNALVAAVDNHPDPNVAGVWQAARRTWQEPTELLEAQKLGARILTQHIHREDLPGLIGDYSPEQMQHLLVGLRGHLEDLEMGNRSPTRVSNRLLDTLLAPGNQEKLRALLRDERADQLLEAVRHEDTLHNARTRIVGGSPTAGRMLNNRWLPQEGALDTLTVGQVLHGVKKPFMAGAEAAAKRIMGDRLKKRDAELQKLRDDVARILTTQGPERDALARAIVGAPEPAAGGWSTPPRTPPAAAPAAPAGAPRPGAPGGGPGAPSAAPAVSPAEAAAALAREDNAVIDAYLRRFGYDTSRLSAGTKRATAEHLYRSYGMTPPGAASAAPDHLKTLAQANKAAEKNQFRPQTEASPAPTPAAEAPQPLPQEAVDFINRVARTHSAPKNPDLVQFLAARGGLSMDDPLAPDLHAIFGRNPYVPGYGSLLRKNGRKFDEAREAAVEAGYLDRGAGPRYDNTTIRDLLDALNDHVRGRKRYVNAQAKQSGIDPGHELHQIESAVLDHFDEVGVVPSDKLRGRVVELVRKEGLSPDAAHERAVMEEYNAGQDEGLPAVSAKATGRVSNEPGAASESGVPVASGQGQSASGRTGEAPRGAGEAHSEEAQRGNWSDPIERQRSVQAAQRQGILHRIGYLATNGRSDAEIARELSIPAAMVRDVRHHLGIGSTSELMGGDDIPFRSGGAVHRASGGRIIGAKTQSEVALSQNAPGTSFRCGTCKFFEKGTCYNENPELKGRSVKPHWCCNLYDHPGMKVIRTEATGRAAGGRAEGGPPDDDLSPEDAALASTMTHYPEAPNPAAPYLQAARDFARAGITGVMRGRGAEMPEWSNRVGDVLTSEPANWAMGMATPLKGAGVLPAAKIAGEAGTDILGGMKQVASPLESVQELLNARGFQTSEPVNAYTGSSYVTAYKKDPATGIFQSANIRVSDHSPGKNFQIGQDHWYDSSNPDAAANLHRYLDSVDQSLAIASARRQQSEQIFDKIGYSATGGQRERIIQDIDRALREGRPTAKMRAVMEEKGPESTSGPRSTGADRSPTGAAATAGENGNPLAQDSLTRQVTSRSRSGRPIGPPFPISEFERQLGAGQPLTAQSAILEGGLARAIGAPAAKIAGEAGVGAAAETAGTMAPLKGAEKVQAAAVKLKDGRVLTGPSHLEIVDNLDLDHLEGAEDGFVTSTGRYVDRNEAARIANYTGDMRYESSMMKNKYTSGGRTLSKPAWWLKAKAKAASRKKEFA